MGDGLLLEFPSVVAAVECAIAIQKLMAERNAETPEAKRIVYRIGVNLGDVLIEGDDILGDGVNIAARLEGDLRARRRADFEHGLRPRARQDRRGFRRSRREDAQEHRAAGAGVRVEFWIREPNAHSTSRRRRNNPDPPRLSIVVLPFANIGGDPEQDYFVDGVTESLTTDLSRLSGVFVISHNTAFTYTGKSFDIGRSAAS